MAALTCLTNGPGHPVGLAKRNKNMEIVTGLVVLGVLTIALVGMDIMYTYYRKGFLFGFSSNREVYQPDPFGLRIKRTLQNQVEANAYIVPVLAAAAFVGGDQPWLGAATAVVVYGRLAYAVLYYSGISFIRVPAFVMGTVGTLYVALRLLGL